MRSSVEANSVITDMTRNGGAHSNELLQRKFSSIEKKILQYYCIARDDLKNQWYSLHTMLFFLLTAPFGEEHYTK